MVTRLASSVDSVRGRADAERAPFLPAHRLVDQVMAQGRAGCAHPPRAFGLSAPAQPTAEAFRADAARLVTSATGH